MLNSQSTPGWQRLNLAAVFLFSFLVVFVWYFSSSFLQLIYSVFYLCFCCVQSAERLLLLLHRRAAPHLNLP